MPLTKRILYDAVSYSTPDLYEESEEKTVIADTNMSKLIGCIHQINYLSSFAMEMFDGLTFLTEDVSERLLLATYRANSLLAKLPSVINRSKSLDFGNGHDGIACKQKYLKNRDSVLSTVLTRQSNSAPIIIQYGVCNPLPALWKIESIATQDCIPFYSNPGYFFQEWLVVEQVRQEQIRLDRKEAKKLRKKLRSERRKNRAAKKELNDKMNRLSIVEKENPDIENNAYDDPSVVSGLTDNNSHILIASLNDSITSQQQVQNDEENIDELEKSITFGDQNDEVNDSNSPKILSDEKNNSSMFSKLFSADRKNSFKSFKEESDSVSQSANINESDNLKNKIVKNGTSRTKSVINIEDNTALFIIPKAPKRLTANKQRKKSTIIIEEKKVESAKPEQYKSVGRRQSLLIKPHIVPSVIQDAQFVTQNISTNRRMSVKFLELPPELSMGKRQGNNEISSDEEENKSDDELPPNSDDELPPNSDDELPPPDDDDDDDELPPPDDDDDDELPPPDDDDDDDELSPPDHDDKLPLSVANTLRQPPPPPPMTRGIPPPPMSPPRPKINIDVLGAIRQGATLKKAVIEPPKIDLRKNLLSAIKSGSGGLKKKEEQSSIYQKSPSIKIQDKAVAAILANRSKIAGDSSSSESSGNDSDFSDSDYD